MNKIEICKKCSKRKFDFKQGILCGLTNAKPIFENSCPDFEKDETVKEYKGLDIKPNGERAKIVILLIWIVFGIEIISLISSGFQYDLLKTASNGGEITIEAANANDMREQIITIIYLLAHIISGITFIMWFRRAYFNLHQKMKALSFNEGWAAGCWFVPIVNLYRPYQIMKELYEGTKDYLKRTDESLHIDLETNQLGMWWGLWIVNGIIGQVIFRMAKNADTIPELLTSTIFAIVASIIGIVLAFITVRIVKDYSKVEGLLDRQD